MRVRLVTGDYDFVTYAVLLPLGVVPWVVMWGSRIFVRSGSYEVSKAEALPVEYSEATGVGLIPVYREGFTTMALNAMPMEYLPTETEMSDIVLNLGIVPV